MEEGGICEGSIDGMYEYSIHKLSIVRSTILELVWARSLDVFVNSIKANSLILYIYGIPRSWS